MATMKLRTALYLEQEQDWPAAGKHVLAQYDEERVLVYQAFRPSIARFAAEHGTFGGDFSFSRMSWIKPNFLWMMYRSSWARKEGQEHVLAVSLARSAFDGILAEAVHSTYQRDAYASEKEWRSAVARSSVRLQWDPDHGPSGGRQARRALQVGLRGPILERYAREWIVDIEDVTAFVHEQHEHILAGRLDQLLTPTEAVYPVPFAAAGRLGVDTFRRLPP